MAVVFRGGGRTLATAALMAAGWLCGWAQAGVAQAPGRAAAQAADAGAGSSAAGVAGGLTGIVTGSLAGRLTDLHSAPLDGATVVVRNEATGAESRTTTQKNGNYRFAGLAPGEYTLVAESERVGRGRLEGIFVSAGHEARVQTAMELAADAEGAAARLADAVPMPAAGAVGTGGGTAAMGGAGPMPAAALPIWPVGAWVGAETVRIEAELMPVRLERLPVPGRGIWDATREMPETAGTTVTARLEGEPMLDLALAGRSTAPFSGEALTAGLALKAVAGGAVAALGMPADMEWPIGTRAGPNAEALGASGSAVSATTLTAEQVQSLPAAGRRWQDFVLDTPAASVVGAGGTAMRGSAEAAETATDGASTRMAFGAGAGQRQAGREDEPSGMGQAWTGGSGSRVAEAALRTVETEAGNAEAEGMRPAGGRVSVESQRGSGQPGGGMHGQGFLFDRQNTWGARNPFTQWVKETAPATLDTTPSFTGEPYTPPDHETVWGVGAGSEWRRRKLFWFGALDSYRRNDAGLATVKNPGEFFAQPSNDQMQVLSARLGLPAANPVAEGLAAYSPELEQLAGLLGPAPREATQWVGFARLDWQAAERHRLTLEGIGARWTSPGGGLTRVSETYGNHSFGSSQASQQWLMGRWEGFITPNLLATSEGSVGRNILSAHAETPSAFEQPFLSPSVWGQLPQMVVDSRYGFTIGNPSRFGPGSYPDEKLYGAREQVDWAGHGLLLKAGFDLNHNADATGLLRNRTGTYHYSTVENFVSDALAFGQFGVSGQLNPLEHHNCDETGKVWRDTTGTLRGLGALPCYSYYSQTLGPTNWNLSTNDWAGYATIQWQAGKWLVFSGGLRWEREQMPPVLAELDNPELPLTERLPALGNNWGPRVSAALGNRETHWPVLRLGYGMYFGRTQNAAIESALTQTGSLKGDLNLFIRPTDGFNSASGRSDAPLFPYVLRGPPGSIIEPGAVEFAPQFHNPEVHQAIAAVEETLPGHVQVTGSALMSLGRRLPVSVDTNFDPALNPGTITYGVVDGTGLGPIKTTEVTVPFYASWPSANSSTGFAGRLNPDYQQITQIASRANSTYEAAMVRIERFGRRGLNLRAHYTYAHATDWNPNESAAVAGSNLLDPADFKLEYGTSDLDVRHTATAMAIYEAPWRLRGVAGRIGNGWMVSGIGQFRSGLPYTMRTAGSLAEEFDTAGTAIVGLGPGMNGSGGDNRVYGVGRNTFRYPATWKADVRVGKNFDLGRLRRLELIAESFNLLNHQNVTEVETTGYYLEPGSISGARPTLNFLTGLKANTTAFGQPLNVNATNFYRERQIQFGLRMRF